MLVLTAAVPVCVAKVPHELALAIEGQVTVIADKVVRVAVVVPVCGRHLEPRQGRALSPREKTRKREGQAARSCRRPPRAFSRVSAIPQSRFEVTSQPSEPKLELTHSTALQARARKRRRLLRRGKVSCPSHVVATSWKQSAPWKHFQGCNLIAIASGYAVRSGGSYRFWMRNESCRGSEVTTAPPQRACSYSRGSRLFQFTFPRFLPLQLSGACRQGESKKAPWREPMAFPNAPPGAKD
mgnify:CR=1 FL=1|jgi:hypothetical protein